MTIPGEHACRVYLPLPAENPIPSIMAAFVTANHWATGVETHKTSEGRILCTGIGCVGCFPDAFSAEAGDLGVCDVDTRDNTLGLRPFLDEENLTSRENLKLNAKNFSKKQKRVKPRKKGQKRTIEKERGNFKGDKIGHETDDETSESLKETNTAATQTELSDFGIDAKFGLLENVDGSCKQDLFSFEEESKANKEGIPPDVDDTVNKTHRYSQSLFDQQSRFGKIHDKMYIVSGKDMAVSSCDSLLMCEDDILEHTEEKLTGGEDAVCFFFALEYYSSQRVLPHFRVMEIVEALSTLVDLKDIKCVQRISRRWHIVLKSRKYVGLLRNCGVKLRGRVYQLVDDVDGYFDVVQ